MKLKEDDLDTVIASRIALRSPINPKKLEGLPMYLMPLTDPPVW
jgi:hypothetical protein